MAGGGAAIGLAWGAVEFIPYVVPHSSEAGGANAPPPATAQENDRNTSTAEQPQTPQSQKKPFPARFLPIVDALIRDEVAGKPTNPRARMEAGDIKLTGLKDPNEAQLRAVIGQTALEMGADNETGQGLDPHQMAAAVCGPVAAMNPQRTTMQALRNYANGNYDLAAQRCLDVVSNLANEPLVLVVRADQS